jgi:signal transduction histidine kinase
MDMADMPAMGNLTPYLQRLSVDGEHAFGLWDSASGFSMFSANFERVSGLSTAACAGHDWINAIHHQQQYAVNEALMLAEEKRHASQCLVQARLDDEEWSWLLVDIKPPTSRQPFVMVMVRNVSEQHALEGALEQAKTALAVSERGRSAFLSSMSHELRTPLNAIMGFSEMMKSGVFGPLENSVYQQYAQHIHESGKLLLHKVADLIDIASMDAGTMRMEESECNARELLHEVIEMHSHAAFERGQQLKIDCPAAITFTGDRAKLACVLSHFVSNAVRHSENGAEVTLSARAVPDDGLIFSVRDAGEGIPSTQLAVIRDALQAPETYFKIEPGGIGLGLSLSRELAGCHGGRIMLDSMRHRGTVASLILPEACIRSGLKQRNRRSI